MMHFSELPCRDCGWRHQLDAFKPLERVEIVELGVVGIVLEWSQYGCPVYVRVQFENDVRRNFSPCELEHA